MVERVDTNRLTLRANISRLKQTADYNSVIIGFHFKFENNTPGSPLCLEKLSCFEVCYYLRVIE